MAGTQIKFPADVKQGITDANEPESETISDSLVPEFQDHIPDPMPILYLKAYTGVQVSQPPNAVSGVVTNNQSGQTLAQYNFSQLAPYGFINVSAKDFSPASLPNLQIQGGGAPPEVVTYFPTPTSPVSPVARTRSF
jgi:hypothetical protein